MKTIISLMLLFFSFSYYSIAQQWSWVNPYPTGEFINQSYFLDAQNGFAVGDAGLLINTIDGGTTWVSIETYTSANLIKIIFWDNLNGWILGNEMDPYYNYIPVFLRTTDGGGTWERRTITSTSGVINDMFFINNSIGWCVGEGGRLFKTINGGYTWTGHSFPQLSQASFKSVIFKNENDGFISGYDYSQYPNKLIIGYSTNGGGNWNFKFSPLQESISGIALTLDSIFISIGYSGLILRSNNKCISWSFCMDNPIEELHCIDFLNSGVGVAGADSGSFLKSTDGGQSWSKKNTGFQTWINSMQYVTDNFLSASGNGYQNPISYPYILTSSDGGDNWNNHTRLISNPIYVNSIAVADSETVFLCGTSNDYPQNYYIYQTTDEGINWQSIYSSSTDNIFDIKSFDINTIFACGIRNYSQGLILRSINGGQSWVAHTFSSAYSINKLALPDSVALYALSNEKLFKSTNMGQIWSVIYQPSYPSFIDMDFVSADVGYLLDGNYPTKLHKTTDGGINWNTYNISQYSSISSLSFPSENVGYACGYNYIFKTTNGGISWSEISLSNVYNIYDITFNDELNGWITANNGIYHTQDGGASWTLEMRSGNYSFNILGLKKHEGLWAVGQGCQIIKYNGDLPTSIIEEQSALLPAKFALLQNYPNPFNPMTKIRYDIPEASQVTLKIYDILGAEVTTLVNEFLQPGRYTAYWNADSFASGVYLYAIKAGNFVETKKMILMK